MKKIKVKNPDHAKELASAGYFISKEKHIKTGLGAFYNGKDFMYCMEDFKPVEKVCNYFNADDLYAYPHVDDGRWKNLWPEDDQIIKELDEMVKYFLKLRK